ncbi:MAG: 50S ribosomal protein L14e [Nanoarchaeota archaeon]|nr:50S ribosomal protein L14e [Nanoarchaeota archaeon]
MKIGQLCIKTAGRDAGQYCVVVENIDNTYVVIDGNLRRKKCNISHLEVLDKVLKIKEKASSDVVKKALEKEEIKIFKKGEKRTAKERPKKMKKKSQKKSEKEKKVLTKEKKEDKKQDGSTKD